MELICIEVEPLKRKLFINLVWHLPPSDPVGSFSGLAKALAVLDKEGKELRDTNCDFAAKEADQPIGNDSKHMFNIYELCSFEQLIEKPTRVFLTTSSINDHIATTSPRYIVKSGVLEVSLSGHYMVYCIRKLNGAAEKSHEMIKRAFLEDASGMCWDQKFTGTDDTDSLVNKWSNLFSLILEKHAPMAEMRV